MLSPEIQTPLRADATESTDTFATVLRAAIAASNLGLARIHDHLRRRGVSVSIATLSYWQSGRSVPGRRSTLAALTHLEDVLKVPTGTLTSWGPQSTLMTRITPPLESILESDRPIPSALQLLDERIKHQIALVKEHVLVVVGSDRTQRAARVRRVIRAEVDGVDRFLTVSRIEDDPARRHEIHPMANCRTGATHRVQGSPYLVREMLLDRVLSRGEPIMVEYRNSYGPPFPTDARHELRRRVPIGELVMTIRFDLAALPRSCEAYARPLVPSRTPLAAPDRTRARTRSAVGRRETTMALTPDASGCVRFIRRELGPGSYGVRWTWA
jgi:hypothetical protein